MEGRNLGDNDFQLDKKYYYGTFSDQTMTAQNYRWDWDSNASQGLCLHEDYNRRDAMGNHNIRAEKNVFQTNLLNWNVELENFQ